jgi:hypothetical protein
VNIKEKVMEIIADKNLLESDKAHLIMDIVEYACVERHCNLLTSDISGMEYKPPLTIGDPPKGWNP